MARGRKPGFQMSEEHRLKIKNSNILSKLIAFCEGDYEMTSTRAQTALGLLKKVMPDLASVDHTGEITHAIERIEREIIDPTHSDSTHIPTSTEIH